MAKESLAILGSGIMATSIAEVAISTGHETLLIARSHPSIERVLKGIEKSFDRQIAKEKISEEDKKERLSLLSTSINIEDIQSKSVVLETIIEDLDIKKALFLEIDPLCNSDTLILTNTSTFPIAELSGSLPGNGENLVGFHFSNPATVMPLVEIVKAVTANESSIKRAYDLAISLGKSPIYVKDQAGFILNGLLFPYLNNAIRLYEMGMASLEDIDSAMKNGANYAMGPFEVLDLVGLDTSLSILETLYREYSDPNFAPRPLLKRLVAAGKLGRKTKEGFYKYD